MAVFVSTGGAGGAQFGDEESAGADTGVGAGAGVGERLRGCDECAMQDGERARIMVPHSQAALGSVARSDPKRV